MRRTALTLVGAGVVALSSQVASAADMRARPAPVYKAAPAVVAAYDWSGFYIGAHAGYAWGDKDFELTSPDSPGEVRRPSFNTDGFLAGGQVGVNWQTGPWVFGAEFQMSWTGLDGSATVAPPLAGGAGNITVGADINWIATLTGRIGYAWANWLWYVKGGVAWADEEYTRAALIGATAVTSPVISDTRTGWTVGIGAEYGWTPNWSVKLEYNYLDFGSHQFSSVSTGGQLAPFTVNTDVDQQIHLVKVGINYRFGAIGKGPVVSRY
jgi:outer membrane immunogenic protein